MTASQIIVLATPVFLGLIAIEFVVGVVRGRNTYRLADAMASISAGMLSEITKLFLRLGAIGVYGLVFSHLALWQLPADAWWVWLLALVGYDFCYYWYHRFGHRVAVGWAAHAVHHQSEDYNLSTALRQTGTGFLFGWIFYLPLAVLGVPTVVFATVALIDLLYQYWVHTQQIGKLGWFDRWFCSPSNHRVHHAVNDAYVDKNYGGILIVWDRMFGTFTEEDDAEPCVYGTRSPLQSWNPLTANLQIYRDLVLDCRRAQRWSDKLRVWAQPPGWRPADVAARWPKPAFDLRRVERWNPPLSRARGWAAAALFLVAMVATLLVLWNAQQMALPELLFAAGGAVALLCAVAALCTPSAARPLATAQ
jgi:sterol desaturase/sphingolipid hydroxylase (fatty acid hydroxylase superfamily)